MPNQQQQTNVSKPLRKTDDCAAALLIDLLGGDSGRCFDVENVYLEQLPSGRWRWVIWEFLRTDGYVLPVFSHPNFYWHLNCRKFLSLWTLTQALRSAGFEADLMLLNYSTDRSLDIKVMKVLGMYETTTAVYRAATTYNGTKRRAILDHCVTENRVMPFEVFKAEWREFNALKKGETWGPLPDLLAKNRI